MAQIILPQIFLSHFTGPFEREQHVGRRFLRHGSITGRRPFSAVGRVGRGPVGQSAARLRRQRAAFSQQDGGNSRLHFQENKEEKEICAGSEKC